MFSNDQLLPLAIATPLVAAFVIACGLGVGTSSFRLFAILGGVFGFGLKRNVLAIYSFCCRNYQAGDRIYCFGFSRGAFTIRVVAGMIAYHGLVPYNDIEADLARFVADAYRLYRRRFTGGIPKYLGYVGIDLRGVRDFTIRLWRGLWRQTVAAPELTEIESIHFVGIWDTVDAYGGPIEEMSPLAEYKTYAELGALLLTRLGGDPKTIHAIPAPKVVQDRTYASAVALKRWMYEHGLAGSPVNIMTSGAHSRRTRLLFQKAFGDRVTVGMLATPDEDFDPRRWWTSSAGFRCVTGEAIAYLYARFLFRPSGE